MTKKLMMMLVSLAVAFGAWAETETVNGYTWTYRINGNTAEIYNSSDDAAISPSPTGTVTIPGTLGGKPVTSIGESAFRDCSGLMSVTIPDSVTSIGYEAFYGCSSLDSSANYDAIRATPVSVAIAFQSVALSRFNLHLGLTLAARGAG